MALAQGKSEILSGPITLHTLTAIEISKKLAGAIFSVSPKEKNTFLIECQGIGFKRVT
jgi:RNA 3'-terminal phosphate cyclase (ATP)